MARTIAVIVRCDGDSWAAWSPQCPGLAVIQPTAAELRNALPGALAGYFDGHEAFETEVHLENELRGVAVRVAQDQLRWERHLLAERIAAALGVEEQAQAMRSAPASSLGDIVYATVLPADTIGWLTHQMDVDGDAITVALPVADELIWTTTLASAADGNTYGGIEYGGIVFPATATFGEVMQADAAPRHIRV
ncbi:hypothetical protein [Candidatus Protofrankia californiensis]|uniref:hypothetical protein n=1 Tax=Candidatus Protofrankia californiensis TaxID=1839754 RepID=UPI001041A843|nr:hypothetical protein [Candidatus Protofrankia californiensis]